MPRQHSVLALAIALAATPLAALSNDGSAPMAASDSSAPADGKSAHYQITRTTKSLVHVKCGSGAFVDVSTRSAKTAEARDTAIRAACSRSNFAPAGDDSTH